MPITFGRLSEGGGRRGGRGGMAFGAMVGYGWDTTLYLLACYVGMNLKYPYLVERWTY